MKNIPGWAPFFSKEGGRWLNGFRSGKRLYSFILGGPVHIGGGEMKLSRMICVVGFMLFLSTGYSKYVSAQVQVIDGPIARNHLDRTVLKMLYQERFDELEKMSQEFRKTKAKFPHGPWKLSTFYGGLDSPKENSPDGWKRFMAKFDKWQKLYPNSITARIAAGKAWVMFGWDARGSGYASTVSAEGWRFMEERLGKAYSLVAKKPTKADDDCPGRYHLLLIIANAQGWARRQYEALFQEAVTFEPTYFYYYWSKFQYLLPKWHGKEGEWKQFAQKAVELSPKKEGNSIYARLLAAAWGVKEFKSFDEPGISWPMMKQGFIDIERNFPGSPWNLNYFCKFAYLAGDRETAKELLARIGDRPYWEAWKGKEFEQCQKLAGIKDPDVLRFNPWTGTEDFRQFLQLAEKGDREAQYEIGKKYHGNASSPYGRSDHVANNKEAISWFRKAAEQGHPEAQRDLAGMYISGMGVQPNLKEGLKWNQAAAYQGEAGAVFSMGYAYYKGQGVDQDPIKAYAWFAQMKQPHQMMKELASKFTPQQIQLAEKEADKIRKEIRANREAAESK